MMSWHWALAYCAPGAALDQTCIHAQESPATAELQTLAAAELARRCVSCDGLPHFYTGKITNLPALQLAGVSGNCTGADARNSATELAKHCISIHCCQSRLCGCLGHPNIRQGCHCRPIPCRHISSRCARRLVSTDFSEGKTPGTP